jgi:hypothetical protein
MEDRGACAAYIRERGSIAKPETLQTQYQSQSASEGPHQEITTTPLQQPSSNLVTANPAVFRINQKAVYQPMLKFRAWLQWGKGQELDGTPSIQDLKSNLPPLRGIDASRSNYAKSIEECQEQLDTFYNGNNMLVRRHSWNTTRGYHAEFAVITNWLLNMVGGAVGRRRKKTEKVVIVVGLGQFSS